MYSEMKKGVPIIYWYIIGTPFFISGVLMYLGSRLMPTIFAIDDNYFGSYKGMDKKQQSKDEGKPSDFTKSFYMLRNTM